MEGVILTFFEHLFHPKEHFRASAKVLRCISERKAQRVFNLMVFEPAKVPCSQPTVQLASLPKHSIHTLSCHTLYQSCRLVPVTALLKMQLPWGCEHPKPMNSGSFGRG